MFDLDLYYDAYPRIEADLQHALDESLRPRGPQSLHDMVADLPAGTRVLDVGCGEGVHSRRLTERAFTVVGLDPVHRHATLAGVPAAVAVAERLPIADDTIDLVWCRDVLVHVADLPSAYQEFRRVLRPGGRIVVYQMFSTDRLEPRERDWLFTTMGVVPASADPATTDDAIARAGLTIDRRLELGTEWGEYAEEHRPSQHLIHAARLLRDPQRYQARFGPAACDIALGDCLWHIYRMIGKLSPRIYVLSDLDPVRGHEGAEN